MRDQLLRRLTRLILAHPKRVVFVVLAVLVLAVAAIPGLRVEAGHSALVDPEDPHQQRFQDFLTRFGSPNLLIAVIEGGNERLRRAAADQLLLNLPGPAPQDNSEAASKPPTCAPDGSARSPGCVRDVVGRIDIEQLKSTALLHLPLEQLEQLVDMLQRDGLGLATLLELNSLPALFEAVTAAVEANAESQGPLSEQQLKRAEEVMRRFSDLLTVFEQQLRDTGSAEIPLEDQVLQGSVQAGVDSHGYLSSPDGKLKLCLIRPIDDSDEPAVVVPLVQYVGNQARAVARKLGGVCGAQAALSAHTEDNAPIDNLCPDGPLQIKLTGLPAIIADETHIVGQDVALTSLAATAGIFALFIFGFRSVRQTVLGLPPLLIGMVCTLAFVHLVFGSLNLVTAAFIATLLGLGIDFAVHLLSRFNEARRCGASVHEATERAVQGAGPGILTGALTTSGAFFGLSVNDFRAFSELGIITGAGLLFVLLTTLTLMPAMLVLPGLAWLRGQTAARRDSKPARFDIAGIVARRPLAFVLAGLALAVAMLTAAQQVPWSYDYIKLMPQHLTSVRTLKQLEDRTDYSAGVAALEATSPEDALKMARALAKLPSIRRADTITSYIPADQPEKLAALSQLKPIFATSSGRPQPPATVDISGLTQVVDDLKVSLEDLRFDAKRGGADAEARLLAVPLAAVKSLGRALEDVPAEVAGNRLLQLRNDLFRLLDQGTDVLRRNVAAAPITVETLLKQLPAGMRDRLYHQGAGTASGHFAVYAYPAQSIGDKTFLGQFVSDVREVDANATGFPVTHWESSRSIEAGFRQASAATLLALVLLLLLDFRSLRYTLLALCPLGIGITWMWGSMSVMDMAYTYVNIIAFPLILGIGVASGVHILHRYRQEGATDVAHVVRFTGMAVFLSAATTMVGFGSLALAQHQGAAGLGILLLVGVGSCLVAATLFLPAVLAILKRLER